jgi:hypothetical protein
VKKIISSILIAIIVLQLFAPFNVNFVSAATVDDWSYIKATGRSAPVSSGLMSYENCLKEVISETNKSKGMGVYIGVCKSKSGQIAPGQTEVVKSDPESNDYSYSISNTGGSKESIPTTLAKCNEERSKIPPNSFDTVSECYSNKEIKQGVDNVVAEGKKVEAATNKTNSLPACGLTGDEKVGTPLGCLAQALYYVFFVPTSALFALTGIALDFSLMYSISDAAYRSSFVVEGWGIIRDFCNMFFIFVMLYIAFGTILNLHGVKTKEMIINVVIIGLLINFSLFATQIIIDTSNILTRVFYNENTIVTGVADSSGNIKSEKGQFGELKLSEAIVSKVNPQELIINAKKAGEIPIRGQADNEDTAETGQGITTSTFIIVTILATAVNIFGMLAFLSCAIIFISRVVGLWMAMIIAPLAFFSYTVPALQSIKMVGWKNWWPETLKLAFLAPIFAFFMYIIVAFMSKGFGIINTEGKTGIAFLVGIIVPFAFVIVLLNKARSIAKDLSGEIGQSITGAISTMGGIALGAGVGGLALAGRKVIGASVAKMSRGDTATQKFEAAKHAMSAAGGHDVSYMRNLSAFDKLKGSIGSKIGLGKVYGKADGTFNSTAGTGDKSIKSGIGGALNKKQLDVGKIDHARHKQDEIKKASGLDGVDNAKLSGENIKTMEGKFKQSESGNIESQFKKGLDAKGNALAMTDSTGNQYVGENDFKAKNRSRIEGNLITTNAPGDVIGGVLTPSGRRKLEDELNKELNTVVKANVDIKLKTDFEKMMKEASTNVSGLTRSFSTSNKNSYDLRKLSEMKTDKREGFLTKGAVGLAALIATGVRGGLRGSGLGNSKIKVEGDFMKDLGATISDSLKSMKVNVNLSDVGEHKSSADSHGGGHH